MRNCSTGTPTISTIWREEMDFALRVLRRVFTNENGSEGVLYLCTSDLTLSASSVSMLYAKRGKIEEYPKRLKSNASFSQSPAGRVRSPSNHFFASVIAYVKQAWWRM